MNGEKKIKITLVCKQKKIILVLGYYSTLDAW